MNPYYIVAEFEREMAIWTGSRYAIAVESCSAALFLSCLYVDVANVDRVIIPKYTYPSVPAAIIHAGGRVKFGNIKWQEQGWYFLLGTNIIDSAKYLGRRMYKAGTLICLSFHDKKALKIGRGGMILTDNSKTARWLRCMRFDGRHECSLDEDTLISIGYNMYLTPEQAARGLLLMQNLKEKNICGSDNYQDLSKYKFFTEANR